ncbi:MAG TPA: BatA domain-containing protein [Planctomycetota bacterium]|nr:BatA domain-containing protein [Planctomycetota bacterium]
MGFLNVLFLAATATALIPVIIHLVQRRRVQQVVFGSLRFLKKTSHRVVHRRRFEEFLLVLLRALALAILAFAFARPFFERPVEGQVGGRTALGEEAVLVLVDNSYSMQAEGRLERAKQEGLKLLHEADPAAKVGVAAYSSQYDELCPIGSTLPQAEETIRAIQPTWRGTNLALALRQANQTLTRADRNEAARRIVLIGDFQESAWKSPGDWTLAPGIGLSLRNVAQKPVQNVFVGRVAVPRLVVAGGFVEVISATVHNLTDKPLSDALVTFRVNGEEKGSLTVNLRPGEEAPVRFRHKFTEPGDVVGSIAVRAEDDLPQDNVAYFCIHVTPRVHVLLVNADRAERAVLNDGLFVKAALVPEVEGVVSPFEVREVAPGEMRASDLEGVDVALFLNVSNLPAEVTAGAGLESPLGRFVAAGGGIGLICGSKVVPEEFNKTFGDLAPCTLVRRAMAEGEPPVVINQVDLRHEIFAEFAQPHTGDFSLAEFTQYFLVSHSLRAEVPARFSNKDAHPVLLERVFEQGAKGKSLLLVTSLDMEWNTLCLKSVFVPFVHQVTKRLCARRTGSVRNFAVGEEIAHALGSPLHFALGGKALNEDVTPKGGAATLRRLADQAGVVEWEKPADVRKSPSGAAVSFAPEKPGIYELAYEGGSARFAANLDPREPDLRPLDMKLLLSTVQKGPALEGESAPGAVSVVAKATARERLENRQKLWRYLLLAVLVALTGEMFLATRIGRA